MVKQQLKQPNFKDRLSQLGYLLKHTFTLVGKDPGIIRPWARMTVYALIMSNLFFLGILAVVLGVKSLAIILLLSVASMFLYKHFYYTRQEMRQSWLVSETLQGRQRSADEAAARVAELSATVRRIALIDMLVSGLILLSKNNDKSSGLLRFLMKGIEEVWDLLNHYLLPSAAVDAYGIKDGIARMKTLQQNVPETLVGVFGIDIAARAVGSIMGFVYFALIVLALCLGLMLGDAVTPFYVGDLVQTFNVQDYGYLPTDLHFSLLPLFVVLWLGKLGSAVLERITTSVKVIYFSIFYMRITHSEDIIPEIRGELDGYLKMEDPNPTPITETGIATTS